jgi:hypothetical protein
MRRDDAGAASVRVARAKVGRLGSDQAAAASLPLRLMGGLQLRLRILFGVRRQIGAVFPEIAPDAEDAFERLFDHARGEGFEGDRPLIIRSHQRPEGR